MSLSMMVDTVDRRIVWVSAPHAGRVDFDERNVIGRLLDDVLVDVASRSGVLLGGADLIDRRRVTFNGGCDGPTTELNLISVSSLDGGRKAMLSLEVAGDAETGGSTNEPTEADRRYEALLRDATNGVVIHDGVQVLSANRSASVIVGWPDGAPVVGIPIATFVDAGDREALDDVRRLLSADPSVPQHLVLRLHRVDGDTVRVNAVIAAVEWEGRGAIQLVMDETAAARPGHTSDDGSPRSTLIASVATDERLRIVGWDRSADELYGWSADEVRGRRMADVLGEPDPRLAIDDVIAAAVQAADRGETIATHRRRDGSPVAVGVTTSVHFVETGELAGMSIEARLLLDSPHATEGSSGRRALLASLGSPQSPPWSVVILLDVDHFNRINQRHGSDVGDAVLEAIWECLADQVGIDGLAVRLHGDRFGILCGAETLARAHDVAARLEQAMSSGVEVGGLDLSISFSMGAAWGRTDPSLFECAATGLRSARRQGGHRLCWFDLDQESSDWSDGRSFAADMRAAMASGAIWVAYQPIVDLATRRILKVEALARWDHPERGSVSPGTFIPLAERHGVIDELGAWVLQTACAAIVEMDRSGFAIDLAVNLSAVQLRHPDVARCVAGALGTAGMDPGRLWIEVTESVLVDDLALEPLHRLHDLGVRLVIDDFGTGYATFQYVTRIPVDALKIDMSFVNGLGVDVGDTAIVRSVIGLGRELGMHVVAEGVETESQRAQLMGLNCRLGQGWLFGRAVAVEEFVRVHGPALRAQPVTAPAVTDESLRLAALEACKVLDTDHEAAFDSLVQLASKMLSTPIALVSLVDADRQWFKARVGIDLTETPREIALCSYAIQKPGAAFVVPDTELDCRFVDNPLVTGPLNIRSYAGVPIRSREGLALGALCVLDNEPRYFSADELAMLATLAEQASTLLDLRRRIAEQHAVIQRLQAKQLESGGAERLGANVSPVAAPTTDTGCVDPPRYAEVLDPVG